MPVMTQQEFQQKFGRAPSAQPAMQAPQQNKPLANQVTDFMGLKGATDLVGAGIAQGGALVDHLMNPSKPDASAYVQFPTGKEALGAGITGLSYAIPGAGAGANLATKVGIGAGTGYAMDVGHNLQENKGLGESLTPGIGTIVGGGLPLAQAALSPVAKIVGSLLKGTGSALSGASQKSIEAIGENPEAAATARNMIEATPEGEQNLVKQNAETIVNGVMNARRQARSVFGNALEGLSKEDIKPAVFREQTQNFLDKYGISSEAGTGARDLGNVEFSDPKNVQKASDLIDKLSNAEMDGRSLRKLSDDIESARYKTATSDERLSFNAFLKDMAETVKTAITKSTPKLDAMNAAFSKDMNLLDATENIFGHVKFGNKEEAQVTARKLENLFNQKGMDPSTTDEFLKRIGVDESAFRASEATRQMGNVEPPANSPGIGIGEMARSITSAVVSPKLVRDITIATGVAGEKIQPFLEALATPARNAVIQALLHSQSSQGGTGEETAPQQ